jgi:biotin carboxyl carrier protein
MHKVGVTIGGRTYAIDIKINPLSDTGLTVELDGEEIPVTVRSLSNPESLDWILVGNRSYEVVLDRDLHWIEGIGRLYQVTAQDLEAGVTRPVSGDMRIKAPIPGVITRLLVAVGDRVQSGQPVMILEAMKMENEVRAPRAGRVSQLAVNAGQVVGLGELLAEIE